MRFASTMLAGLAILMAPVSAAFGGDAKADIRAALVDGCFASYPTFIGMEGWVLDQGWEVYPGADPGEFETGNGDLTIYVAANAEAGTNQGCSVRHDIVDRDAAITILEGVLQDQFPGKWVEEKGWNDSRVWRVRGAGPMLEIYVHGGGGGNSGEGPGSGIGMEVKE